MIEKNNNGETALSLAMQRDAAAVVQLLIGHAADVEYIEEFDETDLKERVPVMVESFIDPLPCTTCWTKGRPAGKMVCLVYFTGPLVMD